MKEDDIQIMGNLEIHQVEKYVTVSVNPKIYPLDVIYSSAYVFLDKAYIVLNGDPNEEVFVELRSINNNNNNDLEKLGRDFNNELINYAVFKTQSEQSYDIKKEIIKKALQTNTELSENENDSNSNSEYLDDPLNIAVPWEEKYEEKNENN